MINWLKSALARSGGVTRNLVTTLVPNWLQNLKWLISQAFFTLARDGYSNNAVVYACIGLLCRAIPEPPLRGYTLDAEGKRTVLPYSHPLHELLRHPNEVLTEYELLELITLHLAIIGRAVLWKYRDRVGRVESLWPLRPDRVGPIYSSSSRPGERLLRGVSYQDPGTGDFFEIPRSDIIFINLPDPTGESGGLVEGLGPLQVLAREVGSDNQATSFVGALLANGAQPGVALKLKVPIPDEETAQSLKEKFKRQYGGAQRGEPILLDADADIVPLTFNLGQLEFPALRNIAESRIAAVFGTPAILVGLKVGLDAGIRATIKEQREYFAETTCSVWWRRIAEQFTLSLAAEYGDGLVIDFDVSQVKALAGQRIEHAQPYKEAWLAGVVTRNEYRAALGLAVTQDADGVDVEDVYLVPASVTFVPVSQAGLMSLGHLPNGTEQALPPPGTNAEDDEDGRTQPSQPSDQRDGAEEFFR